MAECYLREKSFKKWPVLIAIVLIGIATQAAGQFSFLRADQKKKVTIVFAGDLTLGNELIPVIKELGADYPFDSVANIVRCADIAVANLESPLTVGGKAQKKKYTFSAPPSYIDGPIHAGFDLFTLANNHILDFGVDGLNSTIHTLGKARIPFCGAGM
ncbi:MAG: CapA family protein, partial [Candidatus Marinimicrobia bacterium]|nr:CapA family protein [Candidatus Neomarinimicrobiota bacterium]